MQTLTQALNSRRHGPPRRCWLGLAATALLLVATGCTSFEHEWLRAGQSANPPVGIVGRWQGSWQSQANGHNGRLRAIVRQEEDGSYSARFHAIYQKVLGFGYTVPLTLHETNGVAGFSGQANLHWWAGGIYRYEGKVEGTNFFSTYACQYDHGTFQMTNCPPDVAARH